MQGIFLFILLAVAISERTVSDSAKDPCHPDLQSNKDKDASAKDRRLAGKLVPYGLADLQPTHTENERHHGDHQRAHKSRQRIIIRDRKAHGERIDRGRDGFEEDRLERRRLSVIRQVP